ncbi:hypothetical protein J2752_001071 [Halarchaeum rubridurum]|uniref:Uncharacterized protein n=1 Tax=Halarchaeum rubridurum TaxID=489911 RepID=A0A830FTB2_9EURY|nr:hypothetical protein [Halarchaeum rubridurum]MBP1954190.1 hypothetical protein [Halarchaeum rubridurum]GGM58036.1 hypothetical protein GCM10009017_05260 [Halarchaeum rubridurum]
MNVGFEAVEGGLRIDDRIESVTYEVGLDAADVEPASTEPFRVPLTRAVDVTTSELVFPTLPEIFAYRGDEVAFDVTPGGRAEADAGTYELDVSAVRLKLYVRVVDAPVTVDARGDETVVDFGAPTRVRIGVRSLHEHPAGTVTIEDTPRSLMRAVSTFGSALKTTSPERSFPTMRGHPPTIERGERFAAPDDLEPPDTGVRIEVPPRYDAVYAVSSLAYYLGATVAPGPTPRLVAGDRAFDFPYADVARSANALLRHCFVLDCVVRTEGIYPIDLAERDTVLDRVELDLAALYERPLAGRTAAYLDVPLDVTEDVFAWHLTVDVEPSIARAELLPYLVNDLPFVRSPTPDADATAAEPDPAAVSEFFRAADVDAFVRSTRADDAHATDTDTDDAGARVVSPVDVETVGHAWVGDDYPRGASKPTVESYRRQLDRRVEEDAVIDVTVVCNDPEMREEAADLYGFRDMIDFDIGTRFDLSVDETRAVLESDTDFLHFIGHITEDGIRCRDGVLDARGLDTVGADAFILNGCRSYAQGMALVEAGALGGVVTLADVYNHVATTVGRSVARLLDAGFDLHGALNVATQGVAADSHYTIVGGGGVTLCQYPFGSPKVAVVDTDDVDSDTITVSIRNYITRNVGPGIFTTSFLSDSSERYLSSPSDHFFEVSHDRFDDVLSSGRSPILVDDTLRWSDELSVSELR